MASLILTVIGPDRPGLVRALASAVAARGGSWLESRMARLAGQFAGIVLVEAPDSLADDLRALESEGLRITVQSASGEAPAAGIRRVWHWRLSATTGPALSATSPRCWPPAW